MPGKTVFLIRIREPVKYGYRDHRKQMAKLIQPDKKSCKKVFTIKSIKQDGLCLFCKRMIEFDEIIVSNSSRNSKYYHENCARQVMIIL